MLKIKNVSAIVDTTQILSDINLEVKRGEIHAILGPSASGKSTLAHAIQGNPYITINTGSIKFFNKDISRLKSHIRSNIGIFTAFQTPPEIEGLSNLDLIKALFESRIGNVFTPDIETAYRNLVAAIGLHPKFCDEPVNSSVLSPNEWKKGEIIQMMMLVPELIILDEIDVDLTDTDLDIIVNMLKGYLENKDKGVIIITQNKNLLDKIEPSHVHVLVDGEIRESGTAELYKRILEDGYPQFS